MRYLIAILGILCLTGCPGDRAPATPTPPPVKAAPIIEVPPPPNPTADKIKADQALIDAAKKSGDLVAQLQAQKDQALDEVDASKHVTAQWMGVANDLTGSITRAQNAVLASKARWVALLLYGATVIGIIVMIWLPIARTWAFRFSAACAVVATLCLLFAALVPYLIWVGIALALAGIIYGIALWKKSHETLTKLVQGIEAAKAASPATASTIGPVLSTSLGSSGTAVVSQIKATLGTKLQADVEAAWKKV